MMNPHWHAVLRRGLVVGVLAAAMQAAAAQGATLTLPDAILQALAHNPQHLSQQLEIHRAGSGVEIARAAGQPTLDAGASATRFGYPTFVHGIRTLGVFPPLDKNIIDLGLTFKLPLYTGGRLEKGIVLAELGQQMARERERLGVQELSFNVSTVYFKIQQLDALVQVYAARIISLEAQQRRAALMHQSGKTGKLETLRVGTLLTKARHDRLQIENRVREAWTLLDQLAGGAGPDPRPALLRYTAAQAPLPGLEQWRQQALVQRPELQIAQRQHAAGQAREEIARAGNRPEVALVSGLHERRGGDTHFYNDWSVGLQLSLPLFDGGLRRAQVDQAATARRQADLALQQARLEIDKQVEDAWNANAEAQSRLLVTASSIDEAGEALAIETLKLDQGVGVISDVLSAETALLGAQADRLQAQFDLITTRLGLLRAAGALTVEQVQTLVAPQDKPADADIATKEKKS